VPGLIGFNLEMNNQVVATRELLVGI
jgi:hypothetical protein